MVRPAREDAPDTWHHVFNRGIARRTLFERREDFRHFMLQLACSVRRGEIEVHAYALMGTHFHLLVRNPAGRLAAAMQRIQLAYSRHFNRTRRRDGPLVRGRYGSKPVQSIRYRRVLVAYIDGNPVKARLAVDASQYPYGSAHHYARLRGPPWLERAWVEAEVQARSGDSAYRPERYFDRFGNSARSLIPLVERRMAGTATCDPLDDLVGAAPGRVLDWMRRKAQLADGTTPGLALAPLAALDRSLLELGQGEWSWSSDLSTAEISRIARIGVARDLCGASLAELAEREGLSTGSISRLHDVHRRRLASDREYGQRVGRLTCATLAVWQDA